MSMLKEQVLELMNSGNIPLVATQAKVSFPVIERMYKKMKLNIMFPTIRVHDQAIIEGHHRYLASLLAGYNIDYGQGLRSQAKKNILWSKVQLLDEDYYTLTKINILNEEDARYLGISLSRLLLMID